jgi:hypothetical protein
VVATYFGPVGNVPISTAVEVETPTMALLILPVSWRYTPGVRKISGIGIFPFNRMGTMVSFMEVDFLPHETGFNKIQIRRLL